jgi:hypothetical protein
MVDEIFVFATVGLGAGEVRHDCLLYRHSVYMNMSHILPRNTFLYSYRQKGDEKR